VRFALVSILSNNLISCANWSSDGSSSSSMEDKYWLICGGVMNIFSETKEKKEIKVF
jgi:hypothetical protein